MTSSKLAFGLRNIGALNAGNGLCEYRVRGFPFYSRISVPLRLPLSQCDSRKPIAKISSLERFPQNDFLCLLECNKTKDTLNAFIPALARLRHRPLSSFHLLASTVPFGNSLAFPVKNQDLLLIAITSRHFSRSPLQILP